MKRLLFQAVFLATGMIMGVYASGDVGLDLMCGALVAVCCAAVGEYASGSWLAMALIVMLDCGACLVPAWYLMLPIAAFNAASSSAGVDGSRFLQALVPRWLWLLPAFPCGNAPSLFYYNYAERNGMQEIQQLS